MGTARKTEGSKACAGHGLNTRMVVTVAVWMLIMIQYVSCWAIMAVCFCNNSVLCAWLVAKIKKDWRKYGASDGGRGLAMGTKHAREGESGKRSSQSVSQRTFWNLKKVGSVPEGLVLEPQLLVLLIIQQKSI